MVLCALIGSRPQLAKILFSLLILTAYGCGTAPESPVDTAQNAFSDEFVLSGEGGQTLRTIHLSLAPGKTKRYRITTEQFTAKLTQTSQTLAKLSAQHYSNRVDGEPSLAPDIEVVAQDEYMVRNWTFRVQNLGDEPLEATIVVATLPLSGEEGSTETPDTGSVGVETLRTIQLSLAPGKTKRYRITTEQFTAKLTQTSAVLAQLSAKHYSNEVATEPSLAPEIAAVAEDEYKRRNWTFRVHNVGDEQLEATIVVSTLPLVTEETPVELNLDTEVVFSPNSYYSSHLIKVIDALNTAQESVDIAMYSFSDASVRNAVADAVARGITIRMLFENGRSDVNSPEGSRSATFEELGVDVRYINKIMHHKFAIVDGPQDADDNPADALLITGSGNWSYGAASKYDENTTFVKGHPRLVQSFQKQFNFIWENSRDFVWSESVEYFETMPIEMDSELNLTTDGVEVLYTSDNFRTYTSSRYGKTFSVVSGRNTVADRIVELIESAQTSIRIASGHMRSRPIAEAIIAKKQTNPEMDIRVYLDGQEYVSISKHWQQVAKLNTCLVKAGTSESKVQKCYDKGFYFGYEFQLEEIDMKFKYYAFRWNYSYALQMHHKYVIIDDNIVASGSYNFSDNAEHNTIENLVIYHASHFPQLVQGFVENFESIWTTGTGKYEPLVDTVETADEFPMVFDSMALSWTQVYNLKSLMAQHCEEIYSSEFRNNPTEHLTCVK